MVSNSACRLPSRKPPIITRIDPMITNEIEIPEAIFRKTKK